MGLFGGFGILSPLGVVVDLNRNDKPNGDVHACYASLPSCEINLQFLPKAMCMPVQR